MKKEQLHRTIFVRERDRDHFYGGQRVFSFTDSQATAIIPFIQPGEAKSGMIKLPGLNSLAISEHQDKYPVTNFGGRGIQGYTYGNLIAAGSLGFTVLGESPWAEVVEAYAKYKGISGQARFMSILEVPPFDLDIVFVDNNAEAATLSLRSITILDASKNLSSRDIQLTDFYSFQCVRASSLFSNGNLVATSEIDTSALDFSTTSDASFLARKSIV